MNIRLLSIRAGVAVLLLATCAACATVVGGPYRIRSTSDDFTGTRTVAMENNWVGSMYGEQLALNVVQTAGSAGSSLLLEVDYTGNSWIFIEEGESLIFLIDGDRLALRGAGSERNRTVTNEARINEVARWTVTLAQLDRIAGAGEVRMRVQGERAAVDRVLARGNQERIAAFLRDHGANP